MSPRGYELPDRHIADGPTAQLAHREIDLNNSDDRAYVDAVTSGLALQDSKESWKNYREIGEVRYSISRSAKIAGYSTLYPQRVGLTDKEQERRDSGVVAEIVGGITSRFGGTRGLIERFYTLRQVPGETYLTQFREGDMVDGYWFLSPSEIAEQDNVLQSVQTKDIKWVTARTGTVAGERTSFTRIIKPEDFRGRVWAPSGEFLDNAESPMSAINHLCEMLRRIEQSIMARLKSRFAMNGILLVPSEINDAAISGAIPEGTNYGTDDKVMRYIMHIMSRNMMDLDKATGSMPLLMKGPADVLESVRHVLNEAAVNDTDLQLRESLINQILDGLDQQKGQVQDTSTDRFSAWTRSDSERRITVQPMMEEMCHALTRMVLWRELQARSWSPGRIRPWRVWYDLSAASVKANLADEARQLFDRGIVNAAYLRKVTGATDADVMDPDEYVRWVGTKVQNPILMTYGLEGIDVDWEEAGAWGNVSGPAPDNTGESDPQTNPGQGDPGAPGDRSVDDQTPEDDGS